jgi:hypothetical protein
MLSVPLPFADAQMLLYRGDYSGYVHNRKSAIDAIMPGSSAAVVLKCVCHAAVPRQVLVLIVE